MKNEGPAAIMSQIGFSDVAATVNADSTLVLDGSPARVKAAADYFVSGGATLEKFEDGNDMADPDYHGWGWARLRLGR